jgi:hypothetical protein
MSRSRRLEIDDTAIRRDYLRRLAAAGIVAEEEMNME